MIIRSVLGHSECCLIIAVSVNSVLSSDGDKLECSVWSLSQLSSAPFAQAQPQCIHDEHNFSYQ